MSMDEHAKTSREHVELGKVCGPWPWYDFNPSFSVRGENSVFSEL
jgi:hypothetical protein